jgi:choline kinase
LKLDANEYIIDIGQPVKNIDEIEGQYIGLMKFQNEGLRIIKEFYKKSKDQAEKSGNNPLNPDIPFKKSYITDFIRGLIEAGHKIKAIPTENGWLELDTHQDYEIYNKMSTEGTLSNFIKVNE